MKRHMKLVLLAIALVAAGPASGQTPGAMVGLKPDRYGELSVFLTLVGAGSFAVDRLLVHVHAGPDSYIYAPVGPIEPDELRGLQSRCAMNCGTLVVGDVRAVYIRGINRGGTLHRLHCPLEPESPPEALERLFERVFFCEPQG